jgi:hypothetical protein
MIISGKRSFSIILLIWLAALVLAQSGLIRTYTYKDKKKYFNLVYRDFCTDIELHTYIHTTHALAPKGYPFGDKAQVSQRGIPDIPPRHVLPKLVTYGEYCRRDRW